MNKHPSHSPLPWKCNGSSPYIESSEKDTVARSDFSSEMSGRNKANRELIVRAVNSYYEREELIKEMAEVLSLARQSPFASAEALLIINNRIDAVLAKAAKAKEVL